MVWALLGLIQFELIIVYGVYKEGIQLYSFASEYPVILASLAGKTILSPKKLSWHPCQKSFDDNDESWLPDSQLCSFDACLSLGQHHFV